MPTFISDFTTMQTRQLNNGNDWEKDCMLIEGKYQQCGAIQVWPRTDREPKMMNEALG